MPSAPQRDHLRRLRNVWIKYPVYFLIVCAARRRRILACPRVAEILRSTWLSAPKFHGWVVGRYVIMPDHVHFFATPQIETKPLSGFMRDWKKWTARVLIDQGLAAAPVWQKEFFDHIVRSPKSHAEKWNYVRENPVRAGFVLSAEAWPFAGECEILCF
jgi:REP element-mobilizing transposase RayT